MKPTKLQNTCALVALLVAGFLFSCAKTPSGARSTKKVSSQVLNPNVSTPSVSAGSAGGINYTLTSLELPTELTDGTYVVESEMKSPSNKYYPLKTNHSTAMPNAYGLFDGESSDIKIDLRARCSDSLCDRYVMLITVLKNNNAVHQIGAVSYRNDCKFWVETRNTTVTSIYRTIEEFDNQTSNVTAVNDAENGCATE